MNFPVGSGDASRIIYRLGISVVMWMPLCDQEIGPSEEDTRFTGVLNAFAYEELVRIDRVA